jgi:nucleoside permease NupC
MGILIQFLVGLFAIRWDVGRQIFKGMGALTEEFLEYAYIGAAFVYGDTLVNKEAVFAFRVIFIGKLLLTEVFVTIW